jgi:hypothetical protein
VVAETASVTNDRVDGCRTRGVTAVFTSASAGNGSGGLVAAEATLQKWLRVAIASSKSIIAIVLPARPRLSLPASLGACWSRGSS